MNKATLIPRILFCSSILVLGAFVGYFGRSLTEITLEKKVALDEVFNFVAGIIVAVVLGSLWQKYYGVRRAEKDLLLERIRDLHNRLNDTFRSFNRIRIDETNDTESRKRGEVRDEFNLLVVEVETVRRLAGNITLRLIKMRALTEAQKSLLELELILYKQALTLKEYHENYSGHDLSNAYQHFDALNDLIYGLMLSVNER